MTQPIPIKDLIVLVADKNMEATFKSLLNRHQSLNVRPIAFDIFVHPYKDPGCRLEAAGFLRSFCNQYRHALVVFDREGSGSLESRETLEESVSARLTQNGWDDRAEVIVLDPELEVWVWNRSPHVERVLGWSESNVALRSWLVQNNYAQDENAKPARPKEAMEAALQIVKKPRSSSIYSQISETVSLQGHTEPAFLKLRTVLSAWFQTV